MPPTSDSDQQSVNIERSSRSTESVSNATGVDRRPAEGECGICLCSLQEPQSYDTEDEDDNEDDDEDEDEIEEEDDYDYDEEDEQEYSSDEEDGLVWCKAQCGVNYHRECIDQWLASGRYDSCPTCRSTWRD
jgi:hypothetical protein